MRAATKLTRALRPFSLNPIGTFLKHHLAQFVAAVDRAGHHGTIRIEFVTRITPPDAISRVCLAGFMTDRSIFRILPDERHAASFPTFVKSQEPAGWSDRLAKAWGLRAWPKAC
jgi:hypothetical protein